MMLTCLRVQPLLDMSCGSGLFSRRFVKSGKFSGVIAADYSDSMLKQTRQFFAEQADCDPRCRSCEGLKSEIQDAVCT